MDYHKFVLKNGLRVLLVPEKTAKTAAVLILVATGSKYETKQNNGVSHFLEHMFFKGTKKRPNALKIAETLDRVGGAYNAFTSKELTGYWAKTAKQHFALALDWVSDIYLNSKIEQKEITKEKGVILEEINMYLDSPMKYVGELFEDVLYGDQPAGWDTIGTKENIQNLQRKDFINYLQSHYSAKNTIICIAGNFNQQTALNKIKKLFTEAPDFTAPTKPKVKESQIKPNILLQAKQTDQTHLCLGVRAFGAQDEKRYAVSVLSILLGGNMSSRLFTNLREKAGLAYYVSTSYDAYTDHGYLVTQAGVPNNKTKEAINIILKEYKKIKQSIVGEAELKKAKEYLKGSLLLSLESPDSLASFYATQDLLTDKILTVEEKCVKINKVSKKDILNIAKEIFNNNALNLALIGPHKNKAEFEALLNL